MTLDVIHVLFMVIQFTGLYMAIALHSSFTRAIPGSYERFKAVSLMIVARSLVVIGSVCCVIYHAAEGNHFSSSVHILIALIWIFFLKECFDDDNWFKKQFRRLKQGFKKLRSFVSVFASQCLQTHYQHPCW